MAQGLLREGHVDGVTADGTPIQAAPLYDGTGFQMFDGFSQVSNAQVQGLAGYQAAAELAVASVFGGMTANGPITLAPKGGLTNQQLVQRAATLAERRIGLPGRVPGIHKHTYAKRLIDRYQQIYGKRGIETEVSFLGGSRVPYGTPGSVRLDVLDNGVGIAYDYKFVLNPPGLTWGQTTRVLNNAPVKQLIEINP